jgi:hypothetical protein
MYFISFGPFLMFAIVKILTNVGVSRWIDKEKDEFKRDMEK